MKQKKLFRKTYAETVKVSTTLTVTGNCVSCLASN